ncbi:hypothetical protein CI109_101202 [Kwoniella shandongensis]|uniref:Uncharacterized protein n=1 Tax=Kwoniella shandongensis TaxID=1734106 RepID=A0A5M6BW44_9TREE|nr:uncharacterized protein CI109_005480 [Kwoniella shandongensis]KAA5526202.1 hypothetical protein CI109_005480 [Kwoniella shandongensis]
MSYRPRSRSRSPEYRSRRYSPSRPLSPMRGGGGGSARHDYDYTGPAVRRSPPPPPARRYDEEGYLPPRPRSPPPPPRRYDDSYPPRRSPPPRRYDDIPPPRRYDDYPQPPPPTRGYDDRRSGAGSGYPELEERYVPPPRVREYEDRDRYDDRNVAGMVSDREDIRAPLPRRDGGRSEPQWERGRDVEELASGTYTPPQGNDGRRGPRVPAEPSKDVIFLGLDPELTEADFTGYLKTEHQTVVDSVKIVRDKVTGHSKGFGFAQFATVDDASDFINANFPAILMPALYAHSEPRKVKINFSATQAQSGPSQNTYEQPNVQLYQPLYARPAHDGMRDIGSPGGGKRVLLLRGLDSGTTANEVVSRMSQEIARMMGKIGREIAAEGTIVRVVLILDRAARSSWGYGFIELATAELASALLPFLLSPQHQPNGFLINYVPVAASFANPAAFVPTPAGPLGGEFMIRPSRNGGFGSDTIDQADGKWCTYWHGQGGPQEAVPRGAPLVGENGFVDLTPDHRSFLGGLAGVPAERPAAALPLDVQQAGMVPINIAGGLQPIKIGGSSKMKKKEEIGIIPLTGKNLLEDDEEEDLVGRDTVLLSRSKGVHIIPPTSSSRKIAKNISKWNTKQVELATPVPPADFGAPPKGISDANSALGVRRPIGVPPPASIAKADQTTLDNGPATASGSGSGFAPIASLAANGTPPADDFDYTDISTLASTGKVACLLCQRQFKTEDILRKHVAQSDLHKAPGMKRKAVSLAASASAAASNTEASQPKYRDRAAERREAFHQPNVPLPEEMSSSSGSGKRKYAEGPKPRAPTPPPPPAVEPGKDETNVGNQLLAKMGWTAGTGLGKEREGRVDPVMVQQFENRAGLGASKGVEAGRWQGPGGFQQRALDMAKERYHASEPDKK